ncbi:hypothetical protein BJ742DRAFT_781829 [Cladochytrium replicatum]|nr:hypothetical protein BJ742DRAFT_781829 [Cladochytrium replicatum]
MHPPWCVLHRRWITDTMINLYLVLWTFLWILYASLAMAFEPLLSFELVPDENGICLYSNLYYLPTMVIVALFTVILAPLMLWYLKRIEDTYKIKRELFVSIITCLPIYILYFIWDRFLRSVAPGLSITTPPTLFIICTISGWMPLVQAAEEHRAGVPGKLFTKRTSTGSEITSYTPVDSMIKAWEEEAQSKIAQAKKQTKTRLSCPPSSQAGFYETLSNPEIYKRFRDFSAKDFTVECCAFYEHYTHLTKKIAPFLISKGIEISTPDMHIASKDFMLPSIEAPENVRPTCMTMRDLFFVPGSELELNLPSSVRSAVLNSINTSNPIPMNVFDASKNEVVHMLFSNTFEKWQSQTS